MSRPSSVEDLGEHHGLEPSIVADLSLHELSRVPLGVAKAMLELLHEAELAGLHVNRETGRVLRGLTKDEEEAALVREQRNWDFYEDKYRVALDDPTAVESWARYSIDRHAEKEGYEPISWPKEGAK